jgi:hypothetical protein
MPSGSWSSEASAATSQEGKSVRSQDIIKAKLFEVAWRESNGKAGLYGEIIAWCLANRVRRNMGTWAEVLANVPKYRANEPDPSADMPNLWEPNVVKLLQAIDDIYDNAGLDHSNGGIYWCFTEKGANPWFKENVMDNKEYSVKAIQNSLKVWGEAVIIGKTYDPRMLVQRGW